MLRSLTILAFFACFLGQSFFLNAQQGCNSITYSLIKLEPCRYRLFVNPATPDCYNEATLLLQAGYYTGFSANSADGWVVEQLSPTELLLTNSNGFFPSGSTRAVDFTFFEPGGTDPIFSVLYPNICIMEGCFVDFQLEACPGGCVSGTVYRECQSVPYTNQIPLKDWTVQVVDGQNNVVASAESDDAGSYSICDLAPGLYTVKTVAKPGWKANLPPSGQWTVNVAAAGNYTRDFGYCPECSCDSIDMYISQEGSSSDTSTYYLTLSALDAFCFNQFKIAIDTGQIIDYAADLPGWIIERIGNTLLLTPPTYLNIKVCEPCHFRLAGVGNHVITASTTFDNGMSQVECKGPYTFPNPPVALPRSCCPSGTQPGTELVINGDFNVIQPPPAPGSGYTTDYTWTATGTGAGHFSVLNGVQTGNASGTFWACVGKSGNPTTDYFMVVDGATVANKVVWRESVTVAPSTQYSFSIWVNNIIRPIYNVDDPIIQIQIVDPIAGVVAMSAPQTIPESPDRWVNICLNWASPANPNNPYRLEVRTLSTNAGGNDFALDCISFRSCLPVPCTASFTAFNNNCGSFSFTGVATGTPAFGYSWDFGDPPSGANNFSTLQNPVHQYTSAGPHTVTLTITDGTGCTATAVLTITVPPLPSVTITANPGSAICQGQSTTLTASGGGGNSYGWNNSSGGPSISVSSAGTYCVTCTDVNGCTATSCITVSTHPGPIANAGPDQMICAGQSATLTASGGLTYSWSPNGSTANPYVVNPASTTTYTVTVTDGNGCTSTDEVVVQVKPQPLVNAGPDQVICAGQSAVLLATGGGGIPPYTYLWTPGSSGNNPYTVSPSVTTTYTVQVTDANGCTEIDHTTIVVNPAPGLSAGADQIICLGQQTTLTATPSGGTPVYAYLWNPGGFTSSQITVNPNSTTTYTVTLTDVNGCTATDQVQVTVSKPSVNAPNKKVCDGDPIVLSATASGGIPPYTYLWTPGNYTSPTVPLTLPVGSIVYTVLVTDAHGCTATSQMTATVAPVPTLDPGPDITICLGQTATLNATFSGGTPPYSYFWTPPPSNSNPTTVIPTTTTSYDFYLYDQNNCSATDFVIVRVDTCCANTLVQNGNFSSGTPLGLESIWTANHWTGIWPAGPGDNLNGDYIGGNWFVPPYVLCEEPYSKGFPTGDYAGFWCVYSFSKHFRQGIMNELSGPLLPNTGCYDICMKVACPCFSPFSKLALPRLAIYGVHSGETTRILPITPPGLFVNGPLPIFPDNEDLFGPIVGGNGAEFLGLIIVPENCDGEYYTYSFQFDSKTLSKPVDRIFLTRDDVPGGFGGGTYLAIDEVGIAPSGCVPTCDCGGLDWCLIEQPQSGFSYPLFCNSPAPYPPVPCVKQGQKLVVRGSLPCVPASCGTNTVSWTLTGPGGPFSGTTNNFNPNFVINLPASYFSSSGGIYTLTVSRNCGGNVCPCVLRFTVPACPCDCGSKLKADVAQGFGAAFQSGPVTCMRDLKPVALCINDQVTWEVKGVGNYGPSTGNNVQTINFPGPRWYEVCMKVTRTDANGTQCSAQQCQWILVKCPSPGGDVPTFCAASNGIKNSDFRDSLIAGFLGSSGWLPDWDWAPNYGDGSVYVDDSTGCNDEGQVIFRGGKDNFAGLIQGIDLAPNNFTVIEYNLKNYLGAESPAGTRLELRLQESPYPGGNAQILYQQAIDTSAHWQHHTFSVDIMPDTALKYLVICLQNDDPDRRSVVGLDNLEICSSSSVKTHQPGPQQPIRIFPNPNTGAFTVELPNAAAPGMRFRITDLAGRLVQESTAETGYDRQTVQSDGLPNGLYFLLVTLEGRVLAVEKFVKQ